MSLINIAGINRNNLHFNAVDGTLPKLLFFTGAFTSLAEIDRAISDGLKGKKPEFKKRVRLTAKQ